MCGAALGDPQECMTSVGKLAVAAGVITGSLGAVTIPLSFLVDALKFRQGEGVAPAGLALGGGLILLFYVVPSLLVAYGSYLHAAYGEARGRALVSSGSLFLLVTFGICAVTAGYAAAYLIWVRLLLVFMSLVAWAAGALGAPRVATSREGQV